MLDLYWLDLYAKIRVLGLLFVVGLAVLIFAILACMIAWEKVRHR